MLRLIIILIFVPSLLKAEFQDKGIRFENGLTWEELLEKAKKENKYIFVDCYATWCKPCKEMDAKVYIDSSVGVIVNNGFLSIKVQMDSSKYDDFSIKRLYSAARSFENQYNIAALPTYLFFDKNGKLLHKGQGKKDVYQFIALIEDAMNPEKQLYTLVEKWSNGLIIGNGLPRLAQTLKSYNEDSLASEVVKNYLHNYLYNLSDREILKRETIEFVQQFVSVITTNDRLFNLFRLKSSEIDSLVEVKGYSKGMYSYIIYNDYIMPFLIEASKVNIEPNWNHIEKLLKDRFAEDAYSEKLISAKVKWYSNKKDWKNYVKYLTHQMMRQNLNDLPNDVLTLLMNVNGKAWEVFKYSLDRQELNLALKWSEFSIARLKDQRYLSGLLDTKANILYKLGKKTEALKIYKKVLELSPNSLKYYKCMQLNYPTNLDAVWPKNIEIKKDAARALQEKVKEDMKRVRNKISDVSNFRENPIFSGSWKISLYKSNFMSYPPFVASRELIINHTKDSIYLQKINITPDDNEIFDKFNVSLDGKACEYKNSKGQLVTIEASWAENKKILLTNSVIRSASNNNEIELKRIQHWSLSSDGKSLIVDQITDLIGNSSSYKVTAVYDRN